MPGTWRSEAGARDLAGGAETFEQFRERQRRMGAALSPYDQAIATAGQRAIGDAATGAQGGNPFLAQRQAIQAATAARAPLIAQRAAAQSGMIEAENARQRAAEEERRNFGRTLLGAGLQTGGAVLGMALPGLGSIGGGAAQTVGSAIGGGGSLIGQPARAPQPMQPQPPTQPQPMAAAPAPAPLALGPETEEERRRRLGLA